MRLLTPVSLPSAPSDVPAATDAAEPPELPPTGPLAYLRLRAESYTDDELRAWKSRCERYERAFVFFKHEDEAAGPAFAERMLGL